MKKISILCFLGFISQISYSYQLSYEPLKFADQAGVFNKSIIDILRVRQEIKQFLFGKLNWTGAEINFELFNANNKSINKNFNAVSKRPETLFGATFVVVSPNHPQIDLFITAENQKNIQSFIEKINSKSLLSRYQKPSQEFVATNLFIHNPMTQELMPIFISDYTIENYDMRTTHIHIATPAHDAKDFTFAKSNSLPIKLVVGYPEVDKSASPQIDKNTNELKAAYAGDYSDCIIINSDFLNGSLHSAREKAMEYLVKEFKAEEYKKLVTYHLGNKYYSLKELQMIEHTLQKEGKALSEGQKDLFAIALIQAHADFLTIVEQFLINAKSAKDLMIEIITESCELRQKKDAYILQWSKLDPTNISEKEIFKRDINNCSKLSIFCSELIDFLEDFASSCPHALENLKNLKHL